MNINNLKFIPALSLLVLLACNNAGKSGGDSDTVATAAVDTTATTAAIAHADISGTKSDTSGRGTADFTAKDGKVEMKLVLNFPAKANQTVAVHFHEHGDCSDDGEGAHGHWNPTNEKHGKWGEGEYHSGDIGNIQLDQNGRGEVTLESDRWSLGGDEKTNILDRAIIVHSGVDDYKTQPSGNSGSRIGCGVIK